MAEWEMSGALVAPVAFAIALIALAVIGSLVAWKISISENGWRPRDAVITIVLVVVVVSLVVGWYTYENRKCFQTALKARDAEYGLLALDWKKPTGREAVLRFDHPIDGRNVEGFSSADTGLVYITISPWWECAAVFQAVVSDNSYPYIDKSVEGRKPTRAEEWQFAELVQRRIIASRNQ